MAASIKIRIDKKGNVHFEVHGIEGTNCEKLTEALIRAAGDVTDKEFTEEYEQILPDYIQSFEE